MGQFDTHGGYFSPKGYMKVNEGGSHEENPNGGVQVGVDPQGIPNLLEEGEPVYNDYVFSDNIYADGGILEKHNLPKKYAGKLYSEICDKYVDGAADMPLDAIENNGLNAMLLRLADAQEEQKAIQQQKELEEELANMSQEELAELEQMLAEQEAAQREIPMEQNQQIPQDVPPEMMQQPMPEEQMVQQMPMRACGGKIHRSYWPGGTLLRKIGEAYNSVKNNPVGGRILQEIGLEPKVITLSDGSVSPVTVGTSPMELVATPTELAPIRGARAAKNAKAVADAMDKAYEAEKTAEAAVTTAKAAKTVKETSKAAKTAKKIDMSGWGNMLYDPSWVGRRVARDAGDMGWWGKTWRTALGTMPSQAWEFPLAGRMIQQGATLYDAKHNASTKEQYNAAKGSDPFTKWGYADGGMLRNIYWPGGLLMQDERTGGTYVVPSGGPNFPYVFPVGTGTAHSGTRGAYWPEPEIHEWESRVVTPYRRGYKPQGNTAETLQEAASAAPYVRTAGATISGGAAAPKVPSGYVVTPEMVRRLELDDALLDAGIDPNSFDYDTAVRRLEEDENAYVLPDGSANIDRLENEPLADDTVTLLSPYVPGSIAAAIREKGAKQPAKSQTGEREPLPTWPRYAGAITSGLLGLYNTFQEPDKYNVPRVNPVLPWGRMHLIDPSYNPLDQNKVVNDVLATSAGADRALMYSTPNSSVPATLLAHDYTVGRNVGDAETKVWDANNQLRNAVIAAHNQNASTLGNFRYGQSSDRAQILNQFGMYNAQNDLRRQMLNYQSEAAKYAAIQNQIDNAAEALSNIGYENAAYNMTLGPEWLYGLDPRSYLPYYLRRGREENTGSAGGFIKKYKK